MYEEMTFRAGATKASWENWAGTVQPGLAGDSGEGWEFFLARQGQLHTFTAVNVFTFERGTRECHSFFNIYSLTYFNWVLVSDVMTGQGEGIGVSTGEWTEGRSEGRSEGQNEGRSGLRTGVTRTLPTIGSTKRNVNSSSSDTVNMGSGRKAWFSTLHYKYLIFLSQKA